MKHLGRRNYDLISEGVKTFGTYDPDKILVAFEESLYIHEIEEIVSFLKWVHENKKTFGHGNYEVVFAEFKAAQEPFLLDDTKICIASKEITKQNKKQIDKEVEKDHLPTITLKGKDAFSGRDLAIIKHEPNGNPYIEFLDYHIIACTNGDGIVLSKDSKKKGYRLYECHLGNYSSVVDAKKAAIVYFMIARPEDFATNIFHRTGNSRTCHEWFRLRDVLKKEKIAMPEEIVASNDGNMVITWNGETIDIFSKIKKERL